ncbi:isochorismatase family protein [Lineolata rhizophorae]|uniref:Isochorismatase family protein n=1 Tax=Lineolata rhizophorae TaxID=578093 RepID=A0A6A6NR74_9PEZI|nr:isochorismatase family protein [Lineolata rhizophorae]
MASKKIQIRTAEPYAWPHDACFSPSTTAFIIIDMQRDFCEPGGYLSSQGYDISSTRAIIPALQALLQAFRTANFPIYHTREGHRPDLSTLPRRERYRSGVIPGSLPIGTHGPLGRLLVRGERGHAHIAELAPAEDGSEPVVDKPLRSAFAHTDLDLMLRVRGVKCLVIAGVTTDVCVKSTMTDANDHGYDCLLVGDACAAAEKGLHEAVLKSVAGEGGIFGAVAEWKDVVEVVKSWEQYEHETGNCN